MPTCVFKIVTLPIQSFQVWHYGTSVFEDTLFPSLRGPNVCRTTTGSLQQDNVALLKGVAHH